MQFVSTARIFALAVFVLSAVFATAQSPHPGMGAVPVSGGVSFRVWAPNADAVHVRGVFNNWGLTHPLVSEGSNGMWSTVVSTAAVGNSYKYFITNNNPTPPNATTAWRRDPYSRQLDYFVPSDANSVVYNRNAYVWQTPADFSAPTLDELIIYEMHIGSFNAPTGTPATFAQAIQRLDYLVALGINAVELLPLHENQGDNGWGYDPIMLHAIETGYGGADAFKAFVDACHARGIAVLVDVVFNHSARVSNDLWEYDLESHGGGGIWYFNDPDFAETPWGPRPNYTRDPVRQYITDNVRMYLDEFRVDGFRVDATAFIRFSNDLEVPGGLSLLQEIAAMVESDFPGTIMIAEDFQSDRLATRPIAEGGFGFHAEWDSFFASPARALSASTDAARDLNDLRTALTRTFNGDPFRRIVYVESHDTAAQENSTEMPPYRGSYLPRRINAVDPETNITTRKLALIGSTLALTAPGVPMIFQGQEQFQTGVFNFPSPPALDWEATLPGVLQFHREMIALRRNKSTTSAGLRGSGIAVYHQNNASKVMAYIRSTSTPTPSPGEEVVVILNLSATDFSSGYILGVPRAGPWHVHLNTDWTTYDPAFTTTRNAATMTGTATPRDGLPAQITIPRLAPYSALVLSQGTDTISAWQLF